MDGKRPEGKARPYDISKWEVQRAWLKVKENKGAPGADEASLAEFEERLRDNLYKLWNRMSLGELFPAARCGRWRSRSCMAGRGLLGVPTEAA